MGSGFTWIAEPLEGAFVERLTRFTSLVKTGGRTILAHLPNTGRLDDLLLPGAPVIVEKRREEGRTLHDLLLIGSPRYPRGEPIWVSVDTRLPSKLVRWAMEEGLLPQFERPRCIRPEPREGAGRLDLLVEGDIRSSYVETKSVNLLDRSGMARFPDAPTTRGTRHLRTLIDLRDRGQDAWIVFVVVREDAVAFSPFAERDPPFAEALRQARDAGVGVLALRFSSGPHMVYQGELDVVLPPPPFPGIWPATGS